MRRPRGVAAVAVVTVMTVLGGIACGRYGPPVRHPDVLEAPASEVGKPPTATDPDGSSAADKQPAARDDDQSRLRTSAPTAPPTPNP